jgi:glutathione S-transferase
MECFGVRPIGDLALRLPSVRQAAKPVDMELLSRGKYYFRLFSLGKILMIQLFQFPFSHYCEKARWALDYKGIPFQTVNLLPGFHLRTVRKLAPKTSVPLLRDDGMVVQDSSAIVDYLESTYPNPPLTPSDPEAIREALEWEEYFDEEIGVTLRLWSYYHRLPDRRLALKFMLQDAAWHKRPLLMLAYPVIRPAMVKHMNINADTASQSEQRLRAALDRLDAALDGRAFLVENGFSRADLTACALLSSFCLPDDSEASAKFPGALLSFREEVKGRRFYHWVRSVYERYRKSPRLTKPQVSAA